MVSPQVRSSELMIFDPVLRTRRSFGPTDPPPTFGREATITLASADELGRLRPDPRMHGRVGRFCHLGGGVWGIENVPHPEGRSKVPIRLYRDDQGLPLGTIEATGTAQLPPNATTRVQFQGSVVWTLVCTTGPAEMEFAPMSGVHSVATYRFQLYPLEVDLLVALGRHRLAGTIGKPLPILRDVAAIWNYSERHVENTLGDLRARVKEQNFADVTRARDSNQALLDLLIGLSYLGPADLFWARLEAGSPRSSLNNPDRSWG
jgi:hypothetical protein